VTAYGVIIVQSYDDKVQYTQADLDILAFMASHVAVAIARMQADRQIRVAKERWKSRMPHWKAR
jgi:GAF domain-containing protein